MTVSPADTHEAFKTTLLEMTSEILCIELDGFVAVATMTRPDKRNALNEAACNALADLLEAIGQHDEQHPVDPPVRAVLIRGEGPAFCAGADLSGSVYGDTFHAALHRMLRAVVHCPYPVIADVQGPAVGAGTQLSLACDLRVVGERGWFMVPPAKLGFALDNWTLRRSEHLLGGAWTRSVMLSGARVDQQQARISGFASEVGDADQALSFAHDVASAAPLSVKHLKSVLNRTDYGFEFADPEHQQGYEECWASQDAAEARRARAEKRPAVFRGL